MPDLAQHEGLKRIVMLNMAESGSGKTGALASLANAGYKLRILDYDNGCQILKRFIKPEFWSNVLVETLRDRFRVMPDGSVIFEGVPQAWVKTSKLLQDWPEAGNAGRWGTDTVLVIDSETYCGRCIFNHVLAVAGRVGDVGSKTGPWINDWGTAMQKEERWLEKLTGDDLTCHIIINVHYGSVKAGKKQIGVNKEGQPIVEDVYSEQQYPTVLGNKLPPRIGRLFNTVTTMKLQGSGQSARRVISTVPTDTLMVKVPVECPSELPIATGLAELFKRIRGEEPRQ